MDRSKLRLATLALAVAACSTAPGTATSPSAAASLAPSPSPTFAPPGPVAPGMARLELDRGTYFGLNLDWGSLTGAEASAALGVTPAVWVQFAPFPLDQAARANLEAFVRQVAEQRGIALLTLEPHAGLESVTDAAAAELGDLLASWWTTYGVASFVRFAHEMNGSWYAWSQDPDAYVTAFQRVADAVHERSPSSAMVWAPNQGGGYPFSGGRYEAEPGSAAAERLDTDEDGAVTAADDPYGPYYPGDAAVDWVGMSLYHWGLDYPWGENELPRPGTFAALLRGEDIGAHDGETAIPDFYATYAEGHDKPLAIVETAILYDPAATDGPSERALKSAWFGDVFAESTRTTFPRIGMLNWFEWRKEEPEVGRIIDWRLGSDPTLARDLLASAPDGWLRFAGDEAGG